MSAYGAPMAGVYVLGNLGSDDGRRRTEAVAAELVRQDHAATVLDADTPEAARRVADEAVDAGAERIVCVGGDGVVRIAVQAVAGTTTTLGIVPDGTGNDFARAVGLREGELATQVGRALGAPVALDAIRTDHGWVATVATLGFSADVNARANALRWPGGSRRYTAATLLQLPRLRCVELRVDVDGEHLVGTTTLLAVANTAYFGGGMQICPAARPDDAALDVVSIGDVSRRTFLRVLPQVFSGRHVEHPAVTVARGTSVTITSTDEDVWADGDPLSRTPIRMTAVAGALCIAGATLRGPAQS